MERIYCEVCNSDHLVKDGEYFVCESCGAKYKVEDLRKMVAETVEIVAGEKTLEKYYDDASFYMSIEKHDEAFDIYQKITEEFPREYKAWIMMARIRISRSAMANDYLPRFSESYLHEAILRRAPEDEVKQVLADVFINLKDLAKDYKANDYFYESDFKIQVFDKTCYIKMNAKKNTVMNLYFPSRLNIYNTALNWYVMNLVYFLEACNELNYEELRKAILDTYSTFDKNGVFLYEFKEFDFIYTPARQSYNEFFYKHNKRFIDGKELGFENKYYWTEKFPNYDEIVAYKRDLDIRKLFWDIVEKIDFPSEKLKNSLRNYDISLEDKYKYILGNFIMIGSFKFNVNLGESKTSIGCFYFDKDLKELEEEYKIKYIEQRKEAKKKNECPWCGTTVDYLNLPYTCEKCKTIVEDI